MLAFFVGYDPSTGKINGLYTIATNRDWSDVDTRYPFKLIKGIDFPEEVWEQLDRYYDVDVRTLTLEKVSLAVTEQRSGVAELPPEHVDRIEVRKQYAKKPARPAPPREDS